MWYGRVYRFYVDAYGVQSREMGWSLMAGAGSQGLVDVHAVGRGYDKGTVRGTVDSLSTHSLSLSLSLSLSNPRTRDEGEPCRGEYSRTALHTVAFGTSSLGSDAPLRGITVSGQCTCIQPIPDSTRGVDAAPWGSLGALRGDRGPDARR